MLGKLQTSRTINEQDLWKVGDEERTVGMVLRPNKNCSKIDSATCWNNMMVRRQKTGRAEENQLEHINFVKTRSTSTLTTKKQAGTIAPCPWIEIKSMIVRNGSLNKEISFENDLRIVQFQVIQSFQRWIFAIRAFRKCSSEDNLIIGFNDWSTLSENHP